MIHTRPLSSAQDVTSLNASLPAFRLVQQQRGGGGGGWRGLYLAHLWGVVGQQIQCPCQYGACGLVPCHQHGQQIIPELVCRYLIPGGDQEAQDAGVPLIDVALLKPRLHRCQIVQLTQGG